MKHFKGLSLPVFTVTITLIAIILNFPKFFMGNYTSFLNFIVSITFLLLWSTFSFSSGKVQNKKYLVFILVYWGINVISSILIVASSSGTFDNTFLIPFAIWYGCPTYGIIYILNENITKFNLVAMPLGLIFSGVGYCIGLIVSKRNK